MKGTELLSHLKRNLGVVTHETRVTLQVITVKLHVTWQHPKKKYKATYLEEFNSNWLKISRYIVKDIHFRFTELFCIIWSNHERMSDIIVDFNNYYTKDKTLAPHFARAHAYASEHQWRCTSLYDREGRVATLCKKVWVCASCQFHFFIPNSFRFLEKRKRDDKSLSVAMQR